MGREREDVEDIRKAETHLTITTITSVQQTRWWTIYEETSDDMVGILYNSVRAREELQMI